MPHSRDEILALLCGQSIGRLPVFSGLPSVTASGLNFIRAHYSAVNTDAHKMASAAASTFELFGFESAVVPFDLCVEAEALGCGVDFQTDVDAYLQPVVTTPLNFDEYHIEFGSAMDNAGRIPLVADALRELQSGVGREIAIGAWIPGPFTLAWQVFGADGWMSAFAKPNEVKLFLETAVDFLALVARYYRKAGADFITVHEMGGSPQAIGQKYFRQFVRPALKELLGRVESPTVLSMCGDTNAIMPSLAACGANALHVDQRNQVAHSRRLLGADAVLLGNIDPIGTLRDGTPADVAQTVAALATTGVNAIWPGCDLAVETPGANMRALVGNKG